MPIHVFINNLPDFVKDESERCFWGNIPINQSDLRDTFTTMWSLGLQPREVFFYIIVIHLSFPSDVILQIKDISYDLRFISTKILF